MLNDKERDRLLLSIGFFIIFTMVLLMWAGVKIDDVFRLPPYK